MMRAWLAPGYQVPLTSGFVASIGGKRRKEPRSPATHSSSRAAFVKPVRRACARGSKFGQDASLGARSASEMQACWLDKRSIFDAPLAMLYVREANERTTCGPWGPQALLREEPRSPATDNKLDNTTSDTS